MKNPSAGTLGAMSKTPLTNVRIPIDLKERVVAKAETEGKTLSRVVIDLLREYAREEK